MSDSSSRFFCSCLIEGRTWFIRAHIVLSLGRGWGSCAGYRGMISHMYKEWVARIGLTEKPKSCVHNSFIEQSPIVLAQPISDILGI